MRYPIYLQDESYSCGAYCIQMLLAYYHIHEDIGRIKERCGLTFSGVSMYGMMQCLESYHIQAKAFSAAMNQIPEEFDYPYILLVANGKLSHYILLYRRKKQYYICGDPEKGLVYYTFGELQSIYLGKCIRIDFISKIEGTKENRLIMMIRDIVLYKKKDLLLFSCLSLGLSFFTLGLQYLLRCFLVVSFKQALLLSVVFLVFLLLKYMVEKMYHERLLKVRSRLQESFLYEGANQVLKQDDEFFLRYPQEGVLYKLQSITELPVYIVSVMSHVLSDTILIISILAWLMAIHRTLGTVLLLSNACFFTFYFLLIRQLEKKDHRLLKTYSLLLEKIQHALFHIRGTRVQGNKVSLSNDYGQYDEAYLDEGRFQFKVEQVASIMTTIMNLMLFIIGKYYDLSTDMILFAFMLVSLLYQPIVELLYDLQEYKRMNLIYLRYTSLLYEDKEVRIEDRIQEISLDYVSYSYGYRQEIVSRCSLLFDGHYMVMGENGSGKSTLLKLLAGLLPAYTGHMRYNEQEVNELNLLNIQKRVVYVDSETRLSFDKVIDLFDQETLIAFLMQYQLMDFIPLLAMDAHQLSKGQYQYVCFVYVLLQDYDVYLFDEAFNHLDDTILHHVEILLSSPCLQDKLVFCVHHQTKWMIDGFDYVIMEKDNIHIERN